MVDPHALGAPEIRNFDSFVLGKQNVLRFEVPMDDSVCADDDKGRNELPQNLKNVCGWQIKVLLCEMREVAALAILHDDMQKFLVLLEMMLVYSDEIGVVELTHDFDLTLGLLRVEGVDLDLLVGESVALIVADQVDRAEGPFANQLFNFVLLHLAIYRRLINILRLSEVKPPWGEVLG